MNDIHYIEMKGSSANPAMGHAPPYNPPPWPGMQKLDTPDRPTDIVETLRQLTMDPLPGWYVTTVDKTELLRLICELAATEISNLRIYQDSYGRLYKQVYG